MQHVCHAPGTSCLCIYKQSRLRAIYWYCPGIIMAWYGDGRTDLTESPPYTCQYTAHTGSWLVFVPVHVNTWAHIIVNLYNTNSLQAKIWVCEWAKSECASEQILNGTSAQLGYTVPFTLVHTSDENRLFKVISTFAINQNWLAKKKGQIDLYRLSSNIHTCNKFSNRT